MNGPCGPAFTHPAPGAPTALEDDLMSPQLKKASLVSVASTFAVLLLSADGSGAAAQAAMPNHEPAPAFVSQPLVQPVPAAPEAMADESAPVSANSLAELVAAQSMPAELPREINCLAGAIYFESKGESLPGQLAVGRVVVARSKSGRFPNSYCGVVFQPSQFSFVRGQSMPGIDKRSRHWRDAVAVAQIAHEGAWRSPVEGALFFHAAYVSPGWRLQRMARVDNHVFYR